MELKKALDQGGWDAVLSAYIVPGLAFQEILDTLRPVRDELPLILVSTHIEVEQAAELLSQGVWEFVLMKNLARLVPAIERSLNDANDRPMLSIRPNPTKRRISLKPSGNACINRNQDLLQGNCQIRSDGNISGAAQTVRVPHIRRRGPVRLLDQNIVSPLRAHGHRH